jgi:hypothetical protein
MTCLAKRASSSRFVNRFLFLLTGPNAERPPALSTDITINP